MADFSFLSDSDDDKKVEELLSAAMDHSVLEQVAAINCSGFSDSVLPTHLENRFSNLKSFPASKSKSQFVSTSSFNSQFSPIKPLKSQLDSNLKNSGHDNVNDTLLEEEPIGNNGLNPKLQSGSSVSPPKLSNSSRESAIFSPSKQEKDGEIGLKVKSRTGSFGSPSNSRSSSEAPSPPRGIGCFWCSPKRDSSKKNNKENRIDGIDLNWGKNEEFLSDLSTFSTKGQQKLLKKAMKEEEKINREAEKIVKWAKQASARMEFSGLDDELSDHENTK